MDVLRSMNLTVEGDRGNSSTPAGELYCPQILKGRADHRNSSDQCWIPYPEGGEEESAKGKKSLERRRDQDQGEERREVCRRQRLKDAVK